MLPLHKGNSTIDHNSGAIIFKGSPELQAIVELQSSIKSLSTQLDRIIELLEGGITNGREMENSRFSPNNDTKV